MDTSLPTKSYDESTLEVLRELERKVLWLSSYLIHHANHEIDRGDGLKVGGHQASSAFASRRAACAWRAASLASCLL